MPDVTFLNWQPLDLPTLLEAPRKAQKITDGLMVTWGDELATVRLTGPSLTAKVKNGEVVKLEGIITKLDFQVADGGSIQIKAIAVAAKQLAFLADIDPNLPFSLNPFLTKGDLIRVEGEGGHALGDRGHDTIIGSAGDDVLQGEWGNDLILGRGGDDFLWGFVGRDTLEGGVGNDFLDGASGLDTLIGGLGDDSLFGGAGKDRVTGGAGADQFVLDLVGGTFRAAHADTITDFATGIDRIGLSGGGEAFEALFERSEDSGIATLREEHFSLGPFPRTADHRFLYDQEKGLLFFDPDGFVAGGSAPKVLIARLEGNPVLDHGDIALAF